MAEKLDPIEDEEGSGINDKSGAMNEFYCL